MYVCLYKCMLRGFGYSLRDWKRVSGPMELVLQTVVSCPVDLSADPLERAVCTHNC